MWALPAEPVVQVGDRVSKGQLIADIPEGKLAARIHASIDGTVTANQRHHNHRKLAILKFLADGHKKFNDFKLNNSQQHSEHKESHAFAPIFGMTCRVFIAPDSVTHRSARPRLSFFKRNIATPSELHYSQF